MAPEGSGTIRRYSLVGGSVSLWGQALRSLFFKLHYDSHLTSCCLQDVAVSAPAPCLPVCYHAPHHDEKGLNL